VRWLAGILGTVVVAGALAAPAATVTLEDGRTLKGRVIVRNDRMTLLARIKDQQRLFQFPISQVTHIQGDDPQSPSIVLRRTALRAEDSRRSEPLFELERGQEVKRLAVRRGWVQVEAWNEEARGYILGSELAPEVSFSPEERAAAKTRLGLKDPPPPPRSPSTAPVKSEPPSENEQDESVIEQAIDPDQQSDASLTE